MRMFILKNCPHCRRALDWIRELKDENPEYRKIEIELVDEQIDSQLADQYDYYYVPALYDGNVKLHEGVATKAGIKSIFDQYLKNSS
ncbi:glutaredoxin [Thomasclavelia saccharogumia]|uniref:glutaredoxin n=1 Tax=Thomasclavelia saccharogumia TaxID=341225 RepID=UPI00047EB60F|nr:glutaredoxin [Thomasclavelia saccharogumia]